MAVSRAMTIRTDPIFFVICLRKRALILPLRKTALPKSALGQAVNYAVGTAPQSVAVADLNGDGKPDIAVVNNMSSPPTVSVLLGNGDGTFQPQVTYAAGGLNPAGIVIGDVNGDGKPDLVVTSAGNNTLDVLLGNGDGTFVAATGYAVGNSPGFIVLGDFNDVYNAADLDLTSGG